MEESYCDFAPRLPLYKYIYLFLSPKHLNYDKRGQTDNHLHFFQQKSHNQSKVITYKLETKKCPKSYIRAKLTIYWIK